MHGGLCVWEGRGCGVVSMCMWTGVDGCGWVWVWTSGCGCRSGCVDVDEGVWVWVRVWVWTRVVSIYAMH